MARESLLGGREFDLVIFGVTGFTGGLILEYWKNNPERFLKKKVAIAGRSMAKLEKIKAENGERDGDSVSLITADVSDQESIKAMVGRTRVLINCVGPFVHFGEPVLSQCAEQGTHYVDITGEGLWIRDMVEKYHAKAQASGAVIVPACGFDSVPADLISRKAYDLVPPAERKGKHIGVVTSVELAMRHGGISHGTFQTMLIGVSSGKGLGSTDEKATHTERLPTGVRNDNVLRESLIPFELTSDAYVVRRTQKLLGEADGAIFEYRQAAKIPARFVGYIVIIFAIFFKFLLKFPPFLKLLQNCMSVGQGPGKDREKARLFLRSAVRVWDKGAPAGAAPIKTGVLRMKLSNDGYNITAMTTAETALGLCDADEKAGLKGRAGVTTPYAALGNALSTRCEQTKLVEVFTEQPLKAN